MIAPRLWTMKAPSRSAITTLGGMPRVKSGMKPLPAAPLAEKLWRLREEAAMAVALLALTSCRHAGDAVRSGLPRGPLKWEPRGEDDGPTVNEKDENGEVK